MFPARLLCLKFTFALLFCGLFPDLSAAAPMDDKDPSDLENVQKAWTEMGGRLMYETILDQLLGRPFGSDVLPPGVYWTNGRVTKM